VVLVKFYHGYWANFGIFAVESAVESTSEYHLEFYTSISMVTSAVLCCRTTVHTTGENTATQYHGILSCNLQGNDVVIFTLPSVELTTVTSLEFYAGISSGDGSCGVW